MSVSPRFNPFLVDIKSVVRNSLKVYNNKNQYQINKQTQNFNSQFKSGTKSIGSLTDELSNESLDINSYLQTDSQSTFLIRVKGESMLGAGINNNDLLVVDRKMKITNGKIVVVAINDKLLVKKISYTDQTIKLLSENPDYPPIFISNNDKFEIWGAVKSVIKDV